MPNVVSFLKKCPKDVLALLSGSTTLADVVARAAVENKAVRISVLNPNTSRVSEQRFRVFGFFLETVKDETDTVLGRELVAAGAVTFWDWKNKQWDEEKERCARVPLWTVVDALALDEPALTYPAVEDGFKVLYPVSVDTLRSQKPVKVTMRQAASMIKSGGWAEKPTMEVCE
jgi:hypothetical protein